MLDLELSWQQAAIASGCLFAGAALGRLMNQPQVVGAGFAQRVKHLRVAAAAGVAREAGTLLALFALWQLAGSFSVMSTDEALTRAQWLWHAERVTHMPSEAVVQQFFLPHPLLVQVCNLSYAGLHFPVLIACLIWLFARHRGQYRHVRTTVVLFTASALLMQLIPVAPPRMLATDGMVDTAIQYGQSVYGRVGGFEANQLSAMPSVHVGWALLVALVVVHVSGSRWRWLALAYPALTTVVVVATANHFWLDGVVAAGLLALALLAQRAGRAVRRWAASARPPALGRERAGSVPEAQGRPVSFFWRRSAVAAAASGEAADAAEDRPGVPWLPRPPCGRLARREPRCGSTQPGPRLPCARTGARRPLSPRRSPRAAAPAAL